ncbi:MAG: hypothetical protein AW07_03587 [Candidatus Accumulibacter sp. SK-11]|nr:MAG: hypothetical protein AW07_03587 [Candidatus Accumulibacter sp. SK-11]
MLATGDQSRQVDIERSRQLVGGDQGRAGKSALDLTDIGAVEIGPFRQPLLRPAALVSQLPDDPRKAIAEIVHIPPPPSSTSFLDTAWVRKLPGGMLCVSQTLPPIDDPRPMVTRPRMVAPA